MLHILALIVATYVAPPRVPDELLASGLSDRNVRVWLAVRKVQGGNDRAWGKAQHYADVAGKTKSATENALSELRAAGWLEVVGKRSNTPELRCLVPAGEASAEGSEVSRTVRESLTHRETSDPSTLTYREGQVSRTVRESLTVRESPITRIESGQGIRSGESSSENNNNTRAQERGGKIPETGRTPQVLTPGQSEARRRLLAVGVFDVPADRIVRTMDPAWIVQVLQAGEHLRRRGKTRELGAVVVAIADGRQPLPALDPPAAAPRPVAPPPAAEPEPTEAERAAGLAFAERAGLSVRVA